MNKRIFKEPFTLNAGINGGGIKFSPEGITENKFIVMTVKNNQNHMMELKLGFWGTESNNEAELTVSFGLIPQVKTVLSFGLNNLDLQQLFLPRTPGKLKTVVFGNKIKRGDVAAISLSLRENYMPQEIEIYDVYFTKEEPRYDLDAKIIVDKLGQTNLYDWKGKTKGEAALKKYLSGQLGQKAAYPEDWNSYGGCVNKKFDSTGFFRTEKESGRHLLIDPDGCAFYSAGLDCVKTGEECRINDIEPFFEELPPESGEFTEAWKKSEKYNNGKFFDFGTANLIRAFGKNWRGDWETITKSRLVKWGFNTVGNWSDETFARASKIPYVIPLRDFPSTNKTIFRDFPDVFDPEYKKSSAEFAKQIDAYKNDKYLIGYFLRNEPHWAFVEGMSLAEEMLESETAFFSKTEFIKFISKKYGGDIQKFNAAWNLKLSSFSELNRKIEKARRLSDFAKHDLGEWSAVMIKKYVSLPSEELKKRDKNHLNLGMRYAYIWDKILLSGCENFDVFSINCYGTDPSEKIREARETNLPVMIGEFHFGAVDRGLMSTGLRGVISQGERGAAYRYYTERAAAEPNCVGAHYFILNDQAYLGRYDGENFQIGLVDCCHRPYAEFTNTVMKTNRGIYEIVFGNKKPANRKAKEIPRIGF